MKKLKLIVGTERNTEVLLVWDDASFVNLCWNAGGQSLQSLDNHPKHLTREYWLEQMGWHWVVEL